MNEPATAIPTRYRDEPALRHAVMGKAHLGCAIVQDGLVAVTDAPESAKPNAPTC